MAVEWKKIKIHNCVYGMIKHESPNLALKPVGGKISRRK